MGSIEMASVSGFLCRLCSEMHKVVVHIYGDEGLRLDLAQKINTTLPLTITPFDPLPKTICQTCLKRVEDFHQLIKAITKNNEKLGVAMATRNSALARLNTVSPVRYVSRNIRTIPRRESPPPTPLSVVIQNINEEIVTNSSTVSSASSQSSSSSSSINSSNPSIETDTSSGNNSDTSE